MDGLRPLADLIGRVLLSVMFILGGIQKIGGYDGAAGYMESAGVPAILLPLVIILELGGGVLLLIGFQTRIVAFLLGGFCVIAAIIFHSDFSQQMQMILFMKNLAIAGGMGVVFAHGAGALSIDGRRGR
ncbi:DoxX family protein [Minwuia sp.]|uniref:DoxX family protein n=1 Tax=Minwuia sp. TaxID=2493630 RepID=UPI003A91824B